MTPEATIMGLCICVFIVASIAVGLALFANYLFNRNERLEVQNERKTELICEQNNRIDDLQSEYERLEKDYKKLLIERKAKQ